MAAAVTPEQAAALRAPFPAEVVGKLPRIWCAACREARTRNCGDHQRRRCQICGNTITEAHLHLDYVGHAEVTSRLLEVDPAWSWEPLAADEVGLPRLDCHGGLWLRLTVSGVTRLGYGHADGKSGPDAVKEAIGDGLRNAAMRFGVALDLWGAAPVNGDVADESTPGPARSQRVASPPAVDPRSPAQKLIEVAAAAGVDEARLVAELAQRYDTAATTLPDILAALDTGQKNEAYTYYRDLAKARAETATGVEPSDEGS